MVVESGGAVALADLMTDQAAAPLRGKRVLIVASGGHVDAALFASAIS
ncbi:hypothetical protein [Caballeronia pedi]|nr:hypothetical protein [Caballeronia pedi]